MLLRLLEDKNGEVQNLAVRCLGPLVGKVKDYQVEAIVDNLCQNMVRCFRIKSCVSSNYFRLVSGRRQRTASRYFIHWIKDRD